MGDDVFFVNAPHMCFYSGEKFVCLSDLGMNKEEGEIMGVEEGRSKKSPHTICIRHMAKKYTTDTLFGILVCAKSQLLN